MSVFHLKYRPLRFSDLDLVDVAENLKKYLSESETPQSFLLSGPKGSGKTSAARIIARAVNCTDLKAGEPCGKCDSCKEIIKDGSMDVIEMDGASNRRIEDVRNLKDKAYLLPSKLKKKVFIIDEVHMLTKEAFNALLKLIEEPPKHTIFVLCTTDAEKIPDTVLSRLIKVDFRKGGELELLKSLEKIIKGEKIEIDKEAVSFIVSKSDGSFRNLQRNFNELYLQLGKKIKSEDVYAFYLNKSGNYKEEDFDNDLDSGDAKIMLEKIEKMATDGVDFSVFRFKLMNYFQKKILSFWGIGEENKKGINSDDCNFLMNLLIKAAKQEKEVDIDQLPMELVVVEFIETKRKSTQIIKVEKKDFNINEKKDTEAEIKESKEAIIEVKKKEKKEITVNEIIDNKQCISPICIDEITEKWGNLLTAIKPCNCSVEAFLRATRPRSLEEDVLTLEVFYPFHKDRLEEPRNRKIVEDGMIKVFGLNLHFECILAKNKKEPLVIKNDTPMEHVSEQLSEEEHKSKTGDIYDVAKEIFG